MIAETSMVTQGQGLNRQDPGLLGLAQCQFAHTVLLSCSEIGQQSQFNEGTHNIMCTNDSLLV